MFSSTETSVGPASEAKHKAPPPPEKGNQRARKHGLYAKDAGKVDLRRREDRAVHNTLCAIERDLGGSADLSAQRSVILDGLGLKLRHRFKIEAYLAGLSSIVNKRNRSLLPVVIELHRILESIARDLERLGLERVVSPEKDLAQIEAEYAERAPEPPAATRASSNGEASPSSISAPTATPGERAEGDS